MRVVLGASLLALAVAALSVFAIWQFRGERERLLDDFAQTERSVAHEVALDVRQQLYEVDEDARLLGDFVQRTGSTAPTRAAFEALSKVVRQYRAIALFASDSPMVTAVDPAEPAESAAMLLQASSVVATRVREKKAAYIDGPWTAPDGRQFYGFGSPNSVGNVVVLMFEGRLLLQPVLRPPTRNVRTFMIDPWNNLWVGCAQLSTCQAQPASVWQNAPGLAELAASVTAGQTTTRSVAIAEAFGLGPASAVAAWDSTTGPSGRTWTVGVAASVQVLEAREHVLLRRLLGMTALVTLGLALVAALLIRHQRNAALLGARLRHAQELANLRERSDKVVENVPVGLLGLTADVRVTMANRFVTDRFGTIVFGAALEDALPEIFSHPTRLRAKIGEALRRGRPQLLATEEVRSLSAEGFFVVRIVPLERPTDDTVALVVIEDLSELKKLEKQLIRAEKLGTVGVLTAGLAHEIGTPLAIIRGRAETLLEKLAASPAKRDLEAIVGQIDQISSLIGKLLDFSREQAVTVQRLNPVEAANAVVGLLEWRLRQKGVATRIQTAAHLPALAADPDQFQQVLVNLVMNACDACDKAGTVTLSFARADSSDWLRIDITDDGCGIPPEHLDAVFDPFFTTKKRGEGTGLGLPVVASIARNHGAEITLVSKPRAGTTVTLLWPVAREEAFASHG